MARGVWAQPEFRKLLIGQAVSQFGSRISREGVPLTAVLVLGATPSQMGLLSGSSAAAILLFGLFAGAVADRLRRRPVLIAADVLRALVLFTIPFAALTGTLSRLHLCLAAAASGILTTLFDVSYQAYVPLLVPQDRLIEANSGLALSESIAEVAGPGLTGVLVQLITAPIAIALDAFSFLWSAASLALIRAPEPAPARPEDQHIFAEILEGLAACRNHPILLALALRTGTAAFFMGAFSCLYMVYAIRELHLSPGLLGILISIGGCAALAGSLVAQPLSDRIGVGPSLIASSFLAATGGLLLPLAHGSVAACAAFVGAAQLFDVCWPVYMVNERSLRQTITLPALQGRVNSALHLLFQGVLPVGAFLAGLLADRIGMRATLLIGSTGAMLSTFWLIASPIRRLRALPEQ